MFLKQADGRNPTPPNPGAQASGQIATINAGSTVGNQFARFSPASIHESSPMSRTYARRAPYCTHCGFGSPQSNTSARRENHLVILAISYARADNFISSFLIASRLSSLYRNQCHSAQVRITNYSFGKMPQPKFPGPCCPLTSKRNCLAQLIAKRLGQSLCTIACKRLRAITCIHLNGRSLHPIRHFVLARI